MEKANYAEFAQHKPLHTDFVAKIDKLSAPVAKDTVDFAKNW